MTKFWADLRTSFWFLPTLIVLGTIILALLMIEADAHISRETLLEWPRLFGVGASGSRSLLSSIASSTITVAGVVFSMTLTALAASATQYSPRILRNFMSDRSNQVVLGVFVGIFTYCLIVLRSIRGGDNEFIPGLSVVMAILLALIGVGFLIFFIHHIAIAIQINHVVAQISRETLQAIDRLFPDPLGNGSPADLEQEINAMTWQDIPASKIGYIQQIDDDRMLRFACDRDTVLCMHRGIGEFVSPGQILASIRMPSRPDQPTIQAVSRLYVINTYRSIPQDAGFGIQQLVDIAVKALSPGINDTSTAITCLDHLEAILRCLAPRRIESPYRFDQGELRVIAMGPDFSRLLSQALDAIRQNAEGNARMTDALLHVLAAIAENTTAPARRLDLLLQARMVTDMAGRLTGAHEDKDRLVRQGKKVCAQLDTLP